MGPPRLASRIVHRAARRLSWGEMATGDLAEEHSLIAERRGTVLAGLWYWGQALLLMFGAGYRTAIEAAAAIPVLLSLGDRPMTTLLNEVRVACRALTRYPLVTAAIVLTLAIGLGANAAAFSQLDALVLRPFRLPDIDRLVVVSEWSEENSSPHDAKETVSPANFFDWKSQTRTIDHLSAYTWWQVNMSGSDEPERVQGFQVSGDFFQALGVTPALGRLLTDRDTAGGPHRVVVLGHGLWKRRFGARTDIVGQTIKLDGTSYDVVGVAQEGFDFPLAAALWGPIDAGPELVQERRDRYFTVIGHLSPGRSLRDAQADLTVIGDRIRREHPVENTHYRPLVQSFTFGMIDPGIDQILGMIQIGALIVLVIGGANVVNLLLARGWDRRREMALRLAIGAGRVRLLRQLLAESMVLAAIAIPVSLAFAWGALHVLKSAMPPRILPFVPGWNDLGISGRMVIVISAAAMVVSMLLTIFPALQAAKSNVVAALREGGRSLAGGGRSGRIVRSGMVVVQMAVALPLLVASGLAASAARDFALGPQGYDPNGLVTMRTVLVESTYPDAASRRLFAERLIDGASRLSGVEAATTASFVPSGDSNASRELIIDGRADEGPDRRPTAPYRAVSPRYFETLRIPVNAGRSFTSVDTADAMPVAIVSQALASRFWPRENPIGRRLKIAGTDDQRWMTVVGVCGNIIDDWYSRRNSPMLYVPVSQRPPYIVNLVVRAAGDPALLSGELRQVLKTVDPSQPAVHVTTMATMVRERTTGLRMIATIMGVLGVLAVMLAAVGLYSLMAYHVAQRRHEIGVRMALGASQITVIGQTVRRACWLAGAGVLIGLGPAWLVSGLLRNILFNVSVRPELFGAIALALVAIAIIASVVPARQASKVDPAVTLRSN